MAWALKCDICGGYVDDCEKCVYHEDCICVVCEDGETVVCSLEHRRVPRHHTCKKFKKEKK